VTGKRSKAERDGAVIEAADIGLFHEMPTELTDTLIVTSKRHAKESRRRFTASLDEQAAESEKDESFARKEIDRSAGHID